MSQHIEGSLIGQVKPILDPRFMHLKFHGPLKPFAVFHEAPFCSELVVDIEGFDNAEFVFHGADTIKKFVSISIG
jgi:hypothetical protein